MYFTNLLWLFFAHFLGDYPLQGDFLATWKSKSWYVLFVHSLIWTMCVYYVLGVANNASMWKLLFLLVGHMAMDAWKSRGIYKKWGITDINSFYIDQTFHAIQLVIVCF
jgi:hypothetical protein